MWVETRPKVLCEDPEVKSTQTPRAFSNSIEALYSSERVVSQRAQLYLLAAYFVLTLALLVLALATFLLCQPFLFSFLLSLCILLVSLTLEFRSFDTFKLGV